MFSITVGGLGFSPTPPHFVLVPLLVHWQVIPGVAIVGEQFEESLVSPFEKVNFWPMKGRVIVLVVIAILIAQIARPLKSGREKNKLILLPY